jgi:hypothetical protein
MSARLDRTRDLEPFPAETPQVSALSVPYVDRRVLEYLRQAFKPKVSPENDLRAYDRMVGHQEVVAHLQSLCETQNSKG